MSTDLPSTSLKVCEKYGKIVSCISQIETELSQLEKMIHELDLEVRDKLDEPIKGRFMEWVIDVMHYLLAIYQLAGFAIARAEELIGNYTRICEVKHAECGGKQ